MEEEEGSICSRHLRDTVKKSCSKINRWILAFASAITRSSPGTTRTSRISARICLSTSTETRPPRYDASRPNTRRSGRIGASPKTRTTRAPTTRTAARDRDPGRPAQSPTRRILCDDIVSHTLPFFPQYSVPRVHFRFYLFRLQFFRHAVLFLQFFKLVYI